jgi:hypothetical protein
MPEKDGEDQLDRSCKEEEILRRVKEERNIIHTLKRRRADWVGDILRRNGLLKDVIKERRRNRSDGKTGKKT